MNNWLAGIRRVVSGWSAETRWLATCSLGYALLVLGSITNSSLSALDDPSDGAQGLLLGRPQPIRSDEWIRFTPISIGSLGDPSANLESALATPSWDPGSLALGAVHLILHPEALVSNAIQTVSLTMAFAFQWWFTIFLFFAFLPLWLRRMGAPFAAGIATATLIYFSPPNQWWSLHPVQLLGWTSLAAFAALKAVDVWHDKRSTPLTGLLMTGLLTLVSAIAIGRLGTSYLVWVIPLAPMILLPTLAWFGFDRARRRAGLTVSLTAGVIGAIAAATLLVGDGERLAALTSTVYPAARRATGHPLGVDQLLGGVFQGYLQVPGVTVANSNLSELASGWALLFLVVVTLLMVGGQGGAPKSDRSAAVAMGLWTTACYSWVTLAWPTDPGRLNPFGVIPPERMNQVAWVGVVLLAALLVSQSQGVERSRAWPRLCLLGLVIFLVAGLAGSILRQNYLPTMALSLVWVLACAWAAALVALAAVRHPLGRWGPVVALAVLSTAAVNPVQVGIADLRSSSAAVALSELDGTLDPGALLAVDDLWTSALLAANSLESLSGQQVVGPDRESWKVIDPTGQFEGVWNRGASNVLFRWLDPGGATSVESPQGDMVVVAMDPCSITAQDLRLGGLSSGRELPMAQCLVPAGRVSVSGVPKWLYRMG